MDGKSLGQQAAEKTGEGVKKTVKGFFKEIFRLGTTAVDQAVNIQLDHPDTHQPPDLEKQKKENIIKNRLHHEAIQPYVSQSQQTKPPQEMEERPSVPKFRSLSQGPGKKIQSSQIRHSTGELARKKD